MAERSATGGHGLDTRQNFPPPCPFGPPFVRRTKPTYTMSMTPLEELRHSASHVLATALLRLFPDAKLDIGPPTDTGFYYDVDLDHKLTTEDLARIEEEMKKVIDENQPFTRKEVP